MINESDSNIRELRERAKTILPKMSFIIKSHKCVISASNEGLPIQRIIDLCKSYSITQKDLHTFIWWLNIHDQDIIERHLNTNEYDEICEHFTNVMELKTGITFHVAFNAEDCVVSIYPTT